MTIEIGISLSMRIMEGEFWVAVATNLAKSLTHTPKIHTHTLTLILTDQIIIMAVHIMNTHLNLTIPATIPMTGGLMINMTMMILLMMMI